MPPRARPRLASAATVSPDEARQIAQSAFVFGYPLVLMDVTRQVMTAVPRATPLKAPANQFVHAREFPDHTFKDVVSPNADTLYSFAWLDLSAEPLILSVPDVGKRYFLMQMLDAWTNVFAAPGTRTSGGGPADFAIVGPRWKGTLPEGLRRIAAPTAMAWLIGRTQTNGVADYPAVHALQQQYRLTPLAHWRRPYEPPTNAPVDGRIDLRTVPPAQVAALGGTDFLARLHGLMMANPPADVDAAVIDRLAAIDVGPGGHFTPSALAPDVRRAFDDGVKAGHAAILAEVRKARGTTVNGWRRSPAHIGRFGTDYSLRASVALMGLGANLQDDAVYLHATTDSDGRPLSGNHRYVIRFPKGRLPPVHAFWSVTLYNTQQHFVQNRIGRYTLGDRDLLAFKPDGSLTIYLQADRPATERERELNWLPAPSDTFNVILRLYWPQPHVLDATWTAPPVTRVE